MKCCESDIGDFGLIFIRKEDPIGKITCSITKQKYTIIGFYFKTTVSGKVEYKTIYYDIYGFSNLNSKPCGTYNEMQNLEDIVKNPLVSSVALKPLKKILKCDVDEVDEKKSMDLEEDLKLAMIKFSNDGSEKSIREWILEMFGYPIMEHTKGNTSIEYINKIMKEVNLYDRIKCNNSLDPEEMAKIASKECITPDSEGKLELFQVLGSGFTQYTTDTDKLIQAYLYDNVIFNKTIELRLPEHNKLDIELESEISIKQHRELIKAFGCHLIEMLVDDPKFCEIVIGGINKTRNCGNLEPIKLFSPFMIDLMKNNGKDFIAYANQCDDEKPIFEMKLENVFSNMVLYGNFEDNDYSCNDRVIIYKKSGNFLHAFRNMYCQVLALSKGDPIDVAKMIDDVNTFIKCTKLNYEPICSPLCLKDEKK